MMGDRVSNTLGFDDDLDSVRARKDIEKAFEFEFSPEEASKCETVGDIFKVIVNHSSRFAADGRICITAMCFYRLRHTLRDSYGLLTFSPHTELSSIDVSSKALLRNLTRNSHLRLPRHQSTIITSSGICILLGSGIWFLLTSMVFPSLLPIAIVAGLCGLGLVLIDTGRLPTGCQTLGGLARKVAALNFGTFCKQGGRARDQDVWCALVDVLSGWTTLPQNEIRSDTKIFFNK